MPSVKKRYILLSSEFQRLFLRVQEIKKNLLDFNVPHPDCLTPQRQDKLKSFRILVHAELEQYFEIRSESIIKYAQAQFQSTKQLSSSILPMLAYNNLVYSGNIKDDELDGRISRIFEDCIHAYTNNNGIKSGNLAQMFHQIGLPIRKRFALLCAELETYGKVRGSIAHQGAHSISFKFYKQVETKKIAQILTEVANLDEEISSILTNHSQYTSISCTW